MCLGKILSKYDYTTINISKKKKNLCKKTTLLVFDNKNFVKYKKIIFLMNYKNNICLQIKI